jgi:hypothetical protein
MPRVRTIRLRLEERIAATPCHYREHADPPGTSRLFPFLRLTALAQLAPRRQIDGITPPERTLIDTGAWITAIETNTWRQYDRAGLIEHLPFVGAAPGPAHIGGTVSAYELGRLWISLLDPQPSTPRDPFPEPTWLPAVPVVAQLLLDPRCKLPAPILLGLHLGVLDGRKLTREVVPHQPSSLPTDCGSRFGQDWHLETP